jgi:hypothetical protein
MQGMKFPHGNPMGGAIIEHHLRESTMADVFFDHN